MFASGTFPDPTDPAPIFNIAQDEWRARGARLARLGSDSFDECVELALQHCDDDEAVKVLFDWGIADAQHQVLAYKRFKALDPADPRRALSNNQRLVIWSHQAKSAQFLWERAADVLNNGLVSSVISGAWCDLQLLALKTEEKRLKDQDDKLYGQVPTANQKYVAAMSEIDTLKAANEELLRVNQVLSEEVANNRAELDQLRRLLNGERLLEVAA